MRKILSVFMALLLLCSLPLTVLAEVTADVSLGDVTIDDTNVTHTVYTDENKSATAPKTEAHNNSVTVTGSSDTNNVTISVDTSVNVTLDDVKIDSSRSSEAAVDISGSGNVPIELDGHNSLISADGHAGLQTSQDGSILTITDTNKDGSLIAVGGQYGAGIGGGYQNDGTSITITGGTVHAESGIHNLGSGAGIGGGERGNGDKITISGGKVTAIGGYFYDTEYDADGVPISEKILFATGTGIGGGGYSGTGTNITISGDANVTAIGAGNAANVGSGWSHEDPNVKKPDSGLTLNLGKNGIFISGSSSADIPEADQQQGGSNSGAARSGYHKGQIWNDGRIQQTIYKVESDKHMRAVWTEEIEDGVLTIEIRNEPAIVTFWPNGLKYLREELGVHTIVIRTENCETELKIDWMLEQKGNEFVLTQEGENATLTLDGKKITIG